MVPIFSLSEVFSLHLSIGHARIQMTMAQWGDVSLLGDKKYLGLLALIFTQKWLRMQHLKTKL